MAAVETRPATAGRQTTVPSGAAEALCRKTPFSEIISGKRSCGHDLGGRARPIPHADEQNFRFRNQFPPLDLIGEK
jgi:hypothetical protein